MPRSLTLHNIDPDLYAAVRDYAQEAKMSLDAAFKQLVRRELGLLAPEKPARIGDRHFEAVANLRTLIPDD